MRVRANLYGNPTRNKKETKNTLPKYHKTCFDSKLNFFINAKHSE